MNTTIPIYLDCDPGIDDAVALTLLLRSPRAAIKGIGTVAGNVDAITGARNAAGLLALSAHPGSIPVGVGAQQPLTGDFGGGFPHVHGADGLGEVTLSRSEPSTEFVDAVDLLIELAHQYAGTLRVVAIGPLTNLALALVREPDLPRLIDEVYVMGGAFAVPGNVTPHAEANFWSDPDAADLVLRSGLSLVVVPLDVTMEHLLTREHMDTLAASPNALTRLLADMLRYYGARYETTLGDILTPLHDPLTAALAIGVVSSTEEILTPARVVTAGEARGALTRGGGATPVRIVQAVDHAAAEQVFAAIMDVEHVLD